MGLSHEMLGQVSIPGKAGGLEFLHISTPPARKWQEPSLECGSSLPLFRPEARFRSTSRQQAGD
jgi:hypothetical protein